MNNFKIGDYVCTLFGGFAIDGTIAGKHGSADYYAVQLKTGQIVYRWAADMKKSVSDDEFVKAVNARFA